ncbi:MAG: DegQ family serine endoprotease [Sedimentisphaerales bacterium]|nr:DegQ family serine endoprotease [Sedimentisphaerales bacterium]
MNTEVVRVDSKSRRFIAGVVIAFLLMAMPLSAWAEDQQSIATLRQMGKAFASIAEKASPAVVGIRAEKMVKGRSQSRETPYGSPFDEDLFEYFFRRRSPRQFERPESKQVAQGSGFIVTPDGYILTNNHLVGGASEVKVSLDGGRTLSAEVIGTDPETDVAVIKIEGEDLPYVEWADSGALEVGEWVIAIGNPFGLSHTVTAGIVSAKGRSRIGVADYEDFIQTDAAINFGNSGGPLLNLDGQAVGMNTAIIGPGGNVGIGLAIPSNMAKVIYTKLKEGGKVVRGFLGVIIQDLDPEMAESFGAEDTKGVLVSDVTEDSAAEKAGLRSGDVVLELEGEPVTSANELSNRVAMYKPGSKVDLVIVRNGKRKTITAELDKRPEGGPTASGGVETQEQLGLSLQTLTKDLAEDLGYDGLEGVVVTEVEPDSTAAEKGIRPGTVIMEVDRDVVRNVKEFNEAIQKAQKKGKALLRIRSEGYTRFVVLPLSEE